MRAELAIRRRLHFCLTIGMIYDLLTRILLIACWVCLAWIHGHVLDFVALLLLLLQMCWILLHSVFD